METNIIIEGDCLLKLKEFQDESVDAIVTDPPYGLSFMGKKWDYDVPSIDIWKECFRVLKPGGYLLSFSGTRTYHRMVVRIEDAGFEIRDMIAWVYGCLSEDTEVLTPYGWELYHKAKDLNSPKPILIYDIEKNIYKWEIPERWQDYNIYKDTCFRISSDSTDQLVSRNHNCIVEREGKLVFVKAEELQNMENMPTLPNNIFGLQERQTKILFKEMQRILQRTRMEEMGKNRCYEIESSREQDKERKQGREESCLEGRNNLFQNSWKLCGSKICSLSDRIYQYGEKGWLCNGTPIDSSTEIKQMLVKNRSSASQRPQSCKQSDREFDSVQEQSGTQETRGYGITRAKVTKEEYSGLIFCPTVSTGCFVARRNGKIFLTGNSGFPKSLNIGKATLKMIENELNKQGVNKIEWK